jgi:hypothetical protein
LLSSHLKPFDWCRFQFSVSSITDVGTHWCERPPKDGHTGPPLPEKEYHTHASKTPQTQRRITYVLFSLRWEDRQAVFPHYQQ